MHFLYFDILSHVFVCPCDIEINNLKKPKGRITFVALVNLTNSLKNKKPIDDIKQCFMY